MTKKIAKMYGTKVVFKRLKNQEWKKKEKEY